MLGIRIHCLLGVRNYSNNYFAMYTRLAGSRIRVELASSTYLGVRNYLNNYLAMYIRLARSRIRMELASSVDLGLGIIEIIILPCINV